MWPPNSAAHVLPPLPLHCGAQEWGWQTDAPKRGSGGCGEALVRGTDLCGKAEACGQSQCFFVCCRCSAETRWREDRGRVALHVKWLQTTLHKMRKACPRRQWKPTWQSGNVLDTWPGQWTMLTRRALKVNNETQKKTEAPEEGPGHGVPVDEESPWACQEHKQNLTVKGAAGPAPSERSWQELVGRSPAPRRVCATDVFSFAGVMTHLDPGTLSCQWRRLGGHTCRRSAEGEHRKARREGINSAIGRRVSQLGLAEGGAHVQDVAACWHTGSRSRCDGWEAWTVALLPSRLRYGGPREGVQGIMLRAGQRWPRGLWRADKLLLALWRI